MLLEKSVPANKELISKVCESILSKIKVAECCILYDANNDINTSFINNISEQIEKQGDRTGLEMWHNEICLSAFEGFSLSCILPFIEQFKQRKCRLPSSVLPYSVYYQYTRYLFPLPCV